MLSNSVLQFQFLPQVPSLNRSVESPSLRRSITFKALHSNSHHDPVNESASLVDELKILTEEDPEKDDAKELILNLSRRGEGWGEEIVPTVTIEWRPIQETKGKRRNKNLNSNSWKEGSLEDSLSKAGVRNEDVEKVAAAAAAWRVTPKGRPLIDRRRRLRVQQNIEGVVEYLVDKCGVPLDGDGVGSILTRFPQILLAKVNAHERWNRRVVELAAFQHFHGHCNVPSDWSISPYLNKWIRRIRVSWSDGGIRPELVQILHVLGFEFEHEEPYITNEWETQFDAFIEWVVWNKEQSLSIDWNCLSWAKRGGWNAGRVACWTIQQRELRKRGLLPKEAIQRLDAFGFKWIPNWGLDQELEEWFSKFGSLGFAVDEHKSKLKKIKNYSVENISLTNGSSSALFFEQQNGASFASDSGRIGDSSTPFHELKDWDSASLKLGLLDSMENLELESEVHQWLEQQRSLWRNRKLSFEKISLFYSLGLDLNPHNPKQWCQLTHKASMLLMNFEIVDETDSDELRNEDLSDEFVLGPNMLVMPEDIVSISDAGYITERIQWKTFKSLDADEITREGAVITMDPEISQTSILLSPKPKTPDQNPKSVTRSEIQKWVLTQQALWRERRLNKSQVQYLAVFGLAWILFSDVTEMSDEEWTNRFRKMQNAHSLRLLCPELEDFVAYQRGLYWCGMLAPNRIKLLNSIDEFSWNHDEKSQEAREWDRKISELIQFRRQNGHCKVEKGSELGRWLSEQFKRTSSLSKIKALQIKALHTSVH